MSSRVLDLLDQLLVSIIDYLLKGCVIGVVLARSPRRRDHKLTGM
jgi:hypothetical protein